MMSSIRTRRDGHILEIIVARPEKHNALSPEMYRDLAIAYGELCCDSILRVAVLCGDGAHFTSGIDLEKWSALLSSGQDFPIESGQIDPFGLSGPRHSKPIVMAVQGNCFTWGVEIMLNTEIRVAANNTRFAMLEVKRGIFPCGGATFRLPQQMGWSNAQRYLLTGDSWSAQEAWRLGLIQEVVPTGQQYAKAREIAEKVAKAAPLAVQSILKSARLALTDGDQFAARCLAKDLSQVMQSEDAAEGVRSFIERRDAVFSGR